MSMNEKDAKRIEALKDKIREMEAKAMEGKRIHAVCLVAAIGSEDDTEFDSLGAGCPNCGVDMLGAMLAELVQSGAQGNLVGAVAVGVPGKREKVDPNTLN